jgi:hypothetical protein
VCWFVAKQFLDFDAAFGFAVHFFKKETKKTMCAAVGEEWQLLDAPVHATFAFCSARATC